MGPRLFFKVVIIGLVILIVVGCKPASDAFPIGKYIDKDGYVSDFMTDGKFTVYPRIGEVLIENGEYTIDGNTITFYETERCAPVDGLYKWTIDGDRLLLEPIADQCTIRSGILIYGLTRYNPIEIKYY